MAKSAFKNDRYKKARGGYSRLLNISCEKCGAGVCRYQKDGPGNLRRMYLDRMSDVASSVSVKAFACPNGHPLGVKIVYEKENRLAIRLFVDAVRKKIIKSN